MRVEQIGRKKTNQWKQLLSDYLDDADALTPLYHRKPEISSFKEQIEEKQASFDKRNELVEELKSQYGRLNIKARDELITKLKDSNTFTLTTGHQLCLFGGPAYFVYKIAGTIALAKKLKTEYPEYDFVPVYWLASEDHDFEEIQSLRLFGKKISWEREASGPVGRLHTDGLSEIGKELEQVFGNSPFAEELNTLFSESYLASENLSEATIRFVEKLFVDEDLLCLDADSTRLKSSFREVILDELKNESAASSVERANNILAKANYTQQIHIRDINLFYILDGYRERIVRKGEQWQTNDGKHLWNWTEIELEVNENPERFSPNVALRPLYQELILPNLAYIGGGGEMSYWLQLKPIFDHHKLVFPILIPRLSVTAVIPSIQKKIDKLGLEIASYFQRSEDLVKTYLSTQTEISDFSEERKMLKELEESALQKMQDLEEGFRKSISAEFNQMAGSLGKIYGKYKKQVKQREEISINQLQGVQNAIYPDQKLQERVENFALWYLRSGKEGLNAIEKEMDPFAFNMLVLFA